MNLLPPSEAPTAGASLHAETLPGVLGGAPGYSRHRSSRPPVCGRLETVADGKDLTLYRWDVSVCDMDNKLMKNDSSTPEIHYVPGEGLPIWGQGALREVTANAAPGDALPESGTVWVVDASLMGRTRVGADLFSLGVLPLGDLQEAHARAHGRASLPATIDEGDAIFLWVDDRAVVGSGRVLAPYQRGGASLRVDWDLAFHRTLPEAVIWDGEDFPYSEELVLFGPNGGRRVFDAERRPLVVEVSSRDILALIRYGDVY